MNLLGYAEMFDKCATFTKEPPHYSFIEGILFFFIAGFWIETYKQLFKKGVRS